MSVPASAPLAGALPRSRTRLIGREQERAFGHALLVAQSVPLLTLIGTGGVGKTRLVLAIAEDVSTAFTHGIAWIDLAPLRQPDQVAEAAAQALDVAGEPGEVLETALLQHLRPRQALLVVDNCEHVVDGVAALLQYLLSHCPALQVVATSRVPLRLDVEHVLPVEPLPSPDASAPLDPPLPASPAVQLFIERSRAVHPRLVPTDSDTATVGAICRHLDGLPLAIELAAAALPHLSPAALLAHLRSHGLPSSLPRRGRPDRQQTVTATIDWSYSLLPAAAQQVFRSLAVFAAAFDLPAALAVAADADDHDAVLAHLALLIEHHLLRRVDEASSGRFTMLDTIRAFARERLTATEEEGRVRESHAAHVSALALNLVPQLDAAASSFDCRRALAELQPLLAHLDPLYEDLLQALAWYRDNGRAAEAQALAATLWRYWWRRPRSTPGELAAWSPLSELTTLLAFPDAQIPTQERATVLTAAGMFAERESNLLVTSRLLKETLEIFKQLNDVQGIRESLQGCGIVAMGRLDWERAEQLLHESLRLAEDHGDAVGAANNLLELGIVAYARGNLERSQSDCVQALALFRAEGSASRSPYPSRTWEQSRSPSPDYSSMTHGHLSGMGTVLSRCPARRWPRAAVCHTCLPLCRRGTVAAGRQLRWWPANQRRRSPLAG